MNLAQTETADVLIHELPLLNSGQLSVIRGNDCSCYHSNWLITTDINDVIDLLKHTLTFD